MCRGDRLVRLALDEPARRLRGYSAPRLSTLGGGAFPGVIRGWPNAGSPQACGKPVQVVVSALLVVGPGYHRLRSLNPHVWSIAQRRG